MFINELGPVWVGDLAGCRELSSYPNISEMTHCAVRFCPSVGLIGGGHGEMRRSLAPARSFRSVPHESHLDMSDP